MSPGTVPRHCPQTLSPRLLYVPRHCLQALSPGTVPRHCPQTLSPRLIYGITQSLGRGWEGWRAGQGLEWDCMWYQTMAPLIFPTPLCRVSWRWDTQLHLTWGSDLALSHSSGGTGCYDVTAVQRCTDIFLSVEILCPPPLTLPHWLSGK